jgi:hypothetical protein
LRELHEQRTVLPIYHELPSPVIDARSLWA